MAGTNAVAAPAALIALLTTALTAETDLRVDYAFDGRSLPREYVYGGQIRGLHDPSTFRAAAGRRSRAETLTWDLHIRASTPGYTKQENAARAVAIGLIVEETLAAGSAQDGAGVAGLKEVAVSGFEMDTYGDDDAPITEITYRVLLKSILT